VICFSFLYIRLFSSHDSGHEFSRLTRVVFMLFLIDFSISIISFNIRFIGDCAS
jgi:hypothetical protein